MRFKALLALSCLLVFFVELLDPTTAFVRDSSSPASAGATSGIRAEAKVLSAVRTTHLARTIRSLRELPPLPARWVESVFFPVSRLRAPSDERASPAVRPVRFPLRLCSDDPFAT